MGGRAAEDAADTGLACAPVNGEAEAAVGPAGGVEADAVALSSSSRGVDGNPSSCIAAF